MSPRVSSAPYRVSVDELSLYDAETGLSLHFERDHDLYISTKAAQRGGELAAVVVMELGIDGYACHRARLDFGAMFPSEGEELFHYSRSGDEVRALTDAIDTLTALRDQLARLTD